MAVYLLLRYLIRVILGFSYILGIHVLLPAIILITILAALGVSLGKLGNAIGGFFGTVLLNGFLVVMKGIPKVFKWIVKFYKKVKSVLVPFLPNWASTILALVVIAII